MSLGTIVVETFRSTSEKDIEHDWQICRFMLAYKRFHSSIGQDEMMLT
jgi:hypothetical protein